MTDHPFPLHRHHSLAEAVAAAPRPLNVSRRAFLAGSAAALVVATALPTMGKAQAAPSAAPAVAAFLELHADGTATLQSPFIEGGQGIHSAMAQIVGEELDLDPALFTVVPAPAGGPYGIMGGMRLTGGSASTRVGYPFMRRLGAAARSLLVQAAAREWAVDAAELRTEPGEVVHAASGRRLSYGALAAAAMDLTVPETLPLKDEASFRWIRRPLPRYDVRAKSTGRQSYAIDVAVDAMLIAAVQHAPRLGLTPASIDNRAEIEAMRGVHSVHLLDGAIAVVADRFWQARAAAEAAQVHWEPGGQAEHPMPEDFSTSGWRETLRAADGPGVEIEAAGDVDNAFAAAETRLEAVYEAPFLLHGQLEPPSTLARFNDDGTLDLWLPCQAPEQYAGAAATIAGLSPENVRIHSQVLGGFFGRHFLYAHANPFRQAVPLAKAVGRPVKVMWTREEEFLRDTVRPFGLARFRGAVDANGPVALSIEVVGEGPTGRWYGAPAGADPSAHEGLSGKPYAIANRRLGHVPVQNPAEIGYWRSVGHSMHDFFYESFLDEMALAAGQDPLSLRRTLLAGQTRYLALLDAVAELSGGWRGAAYDHADGTTRARGVAMASPFGSEVATIAEVSVDRGRVKVHEIWVAIDPGQIVNPQTVVAQVQSAVALGVSQTLVEGLTYEQGEPTARNFDAYPILSPDEMPAVHVRILESGAPMGGVGEPGLPGVMPAITNALATLTGRRIRSLPLSAHDFN
ncbi:molybdopterin cofactor-binding domain-containing protein [Pararhodobacter sp. CCB-MM2]|uniref:xanthine dehydrogenase family protein molybdopterin-binding subunit n=1 Tax=Pararhodobacter sp. CCB-MM2 TaxID=1786003 RepID=UPI0009F38E3C|nr:molybdopterin cofactor-binding domain-containing protein [Pararhodobacter sp. CCB-MM2]